MFRLVDVWMLRNGGHGGGFPAEHQIPWNPVGRTFIQEELLSQSQITADAPARKSAPRFEMMILRGKDGDDPMGGYVKPLDKGLEISKRLGCLGYLHKPL